MNNILNFIGHVVLISVPEEYMYAFLGLFFIKLFKVYNHNYFDIHNDFLKNTIRLFYISVAPMAILSDLLIYFKIDETIITAVGLFATSLTLILYCRIKTVKKCIFVIPIVFISFVIGSFIDVLAYSLIFGITGTNLDYFKQSLMLTTLLTLFSRLIEYIAIVLILFKKNTIIKTDMFKTIIKSKTLFLIFCVYIILNTTFFIVFCRYVLTGDILINIDTIMKILITFGLFVLVLIDLVSMWLVTTIIQIKERHKYKYGREANI